MIIALSVDAGQVVTDLFQIRTKTPSGSRRSPLSAKPERIATRVEVEFSGSIASCGVKGSRDALRARAPTASVARPCPRCPESRA